MITPDREDRAESGRRQGGLSNAARAGVAAVVGEPESGLFDVET
jgi:hypothetical protein